MTHRYNPFYNNCIHLQWRYPKSTYIGNSHSRVIAFCKLYKCNAYDIKLPDDIQICCVSYSAYLKKANCKGFKDKNCQTMLNQFMG